jgi:hypothetical protein
VLDVNVLVSAAEAEAFLQLLATRAQVVLDSESATARELA